MRGRKPTPTALKTLRGNPGKRRLPASEPKPAALAEFSAPAHLGKEAAAEWRRVTSELRLLGMLTAIDLGMLEAYCSARGDFIRAERALRLGIVTKDRDGTSRRNPWFMVKAKAIEQIKQLGCEFGMSPASRPRLGRAPIEPPDGIGIPTGESGPATEGFDAFLASKPKAAPVH